MVDIDPAVLTAIAVVLLTALALILRRPAALNGGGGGGEASNVSTALSDEPAARKRKPWPTYRLAEVVELSYNTKLFRFAMPSADAALSLPVGHHIMVRAEVNGEVVVRPYTPVSHPAQKGHFDLVVKVYQLGKLSTHLHALRVGALVEMKGPVGRLKYAPGQYTHMVLIGAGSGLTPVLQVAKHVLLNAGDRTRLTFVFQNREERDILLRSELEVLARDHSGRIAMHFVLSRPPAGWSRSAGKRGAAAEGAVQHHQGYTDAELLRGIGVEAASGTHAFLCGPGGFNDSALRALQEVGLLKDDVTIF